MLMDINLPEPLGDGEIAEVRHYAWELIRLWRTRTIYSTLALFLSCALVYPFLAGHSLHAHWESIGKRLLLLPMALLVVLAYCLGLLLSARMALREVERGQSSR
jgi:hypothetical protein